MTALVFTPLNHFHTPEPRPNFFDLDPSPWGYVWRNLFRPRTQISVGPFPSYGPWGVDWNGSLWTLFFEGACYLAIAGLGLLGLLRRFRWFGAACLFAFIAL